MNIVDLSTRWIDVRELFLSKKITISLSHKLLKNVYTVKKNLNPVKLISGSERNRAQLDEFNSKKQPGDCFGLQHTMIDPQ